MKRSLWGFVVFPGASKEMLPLVETAHGNGSLLVSPVVEKPGDTRQLNCW
jgi:hypothetical protein